MSFDETDELYTVSIKLSITLIAFLELLALGSMETILREQDRCSLCPPEVHRRLEKAFKEKTIAGSRSRGCEGECGMGAGSLANSRFEGSRKASWSDVQIGVPNES